MTIDPRYAPVFASFKVQSRFQLFNSGTQRALEVAFNSESCFYCFFRLFNLSAIFTAYVRRRFRLLSNIEPQVTESTCRAASAEFMGSETNSEFN